MKPIKENKIKGEKIKSKKNIKPYYQMFNYWGGGGSTQYKYSKRELFYLTQGL